MTISMTRPVIRFPGLSGLFVPNDYVLELSRRHPEFLPAVSIHPARPDAIAELERCAAAGAVLMKLLPCVQAVDCNRQIYKPFWERMARLNLPLLAHTGGEFSLPTHRRDLQSVETLRLPLQCGVTVIAAHCGTPALPWDQDYFDQFDQMRKSFPNLYGDLSALSQITHLRTLDRLRKDPRQILYGSDYPVVTTAFWSRLQRVDHQSRLTSGSVQFVIRWRKSFSSPSLSAFRTEFYRFLEALPATESTVRSSRD